MGWRKTLRDQGGWAPPGVSGQRKALRGWGGGKEQRGRGRREALRGRGGGQALKGWGAGSPERVGWQEAIRSPHAATSFLATLLPWCFPKALPVPAAEALEARPRQDGGDTRQHAWAGLARGEAGEGAPQGHVCWVLLARGSGQRQGWWPARAPGLPRPRPCGQDPTDTELRACRAGVTMRRAMVSERRTAQKVLPSACSSFVGRKQWKTQALKQPGP